MKFQAASLVLALTGLYGSPVLAVPVGKVLFSQPGTEIVNEKGEKRPAKRGEQLESGERLLTPPGAITQVLLPDGSLVGARPGSELKLDATGPVGERPGQVISLVQGSLRVIGSELMDAKKPSALTVQTGLATLKLSGADLESAVIKPTDFRTAGTPDAGSYSRLLVGTGSIGSGALVEPLPVRQVSFVGAANVAPVTLASVSPNLFSSTPVLTAANLSSLTASASAGTVSTTASKVSAPLATTSTLTAPPLTSSLAGTSSGTKTLTTAPLVTSPTVKTVSLTTSPVVTTSPLVATAPITTAPVVTSSLLTSPTTVLSKPVTTTLITKTCTNVIIGGKKVCI